ncbi:hypothetical protein PIB30_064242, partial [Stylosanthes scabra]|nr:hypothetical protein [Stylosanthes scabra]
MDSCSLAAELFVSNGIAGETCTGRGFVDTEHCRSDIGFQPFRWVVSLKVLVTALSKTTHGYPYCAY